MIDMIRTEAPNPDPNAQRLGRELLERRAAQGVQVEAQTVCASRDKPTGLKVP
jgi:hypothetical protein